MANSLESQWDMAFVLFMIFFYYSLYRYTCSVFESKEPICQHVWSQVKKPFGSISFSLAGGSWVRATWRTYDPTPRLTLLPFSTEQWICRFSWNWVLLLMHSLVQKWDFYYVQEVISPKLEIKFLGKIWKWLKWRHYLISLQFFQLLPLDQAKWVDYTIDRGSYWVPLFTGPRYIFLFKTLSDIKWTNVILPSVSQNSNLL